MTFRFHPEAAAEFDEATGYYESQQTGLGLEFAEEVYAAIFRVLRFPDAGNPLSANTRRCLANRFPYGIIYQAKPDGLRIIAVANLHRRPGYWKHREHA
jgi:plasmid stabilization system protein ParE